MVLLCDKSPRFTKPRHEKVTRHLFVANCGTQLGDTIGDIESFFSPWQVEVTVPTVARSHAFVSFKSEEEARLAMELLNCKPCQAAGGRCFKMQYADTKTQARKNVNNQGPPTLGGAAAQGGCAHKMRVSTRQFS
jgi:hypothetical protein